MAYRDTRTEERVSDTPARRPVHDGPGRSLAAVGPGMVLGLVGTVALVVSIFTTWRDPGIHADDVPLRFLVDSDTTTRHPSLLLALVPLAVLALLGSLMPGGRLLRLVAGIGALVVAVLFAVQVNDLVDGLPGADTFDVLDVGFYAAAVAGVLLVLSGFVRFGGGGRRSDDRFVDLR